MGKGLSVESQGKFLQEIAAEVQLGEVREDGEGGYVGNLGRRGGGEGEGHIHQIHSHCFPLAVRQTQTD